MQIPHCAMVIERHLFGVICCFGWQIRNSTVEPVNGLSVLQIRTPTVTIDASAQAHLLNVRRENGLIINALIRVSSFNNQDARRP